MSYLQSTAIPNNIYQKANHFTLYSSLFLYHLYPYLLILAFLASCLEMKRIVILIGIFSSNMTQIIIYNHSPNISFFMCILSLLFVLIAFWFIFTSKSSTFLVKSMTICDSILFGCALTWIFLTIATSIPNFDVEKIGFIVANIILAISLLAIDFQARVSFVDTAEAIKSNHIETNNEDCVGGSFVECIGGMSSGLEEKNDMNHIVPIEFKESYLYDGFRVRMNRLHGTDPSMSKTLIWTDFTNIEHKVTSTSCDIFTAIWDSAPVILKIIKIERLNSEVALSEFEMEANVLSRVHHPNIIKLLGSGVDPRPFLVLEYLQGGTLSQRMKTGNWRTGNFLQKSHTLSEALHDATALISALNYLQCEWSPHMSIIHRDIKPDNIGRYFI